MLCMDKCYTFGVSNFYFFCNKLNSIHRILVLSYFLNRKYRHNQQSWLSLKIFQRLLKFQLKRSLYLCTEPIWNQNKFTMGLGVTVHGHSSDYSCVMQHAFTNHIKKMFGVFFKLFKILEMFSHNPCLKEIFFSSL